MGECLIALSDSLINSTADKKGKAVAILHYYGDLLAHTVTPNSGFGSSVIYPVTGPADSLIGTEAGTTALPSSSDLPTATATAAVESSDDVYTQAQANSENVRK